MTPVPRELPIDDLIPAVCDAVKHSRIVIVEAPPGAGKTTRVPRALLAQNHIQGQIWVSQPRRIAARLSAQYVAAELGEPLGGRVGYSVRFEDVTSERTQLFYATAGTLLRRLAFSRSLPRIGCVVLDEFHERGIDTDALLCLLQRLQQTERPDLKVLIMSATLDTEGLRQKFSDCPFLTSQGRSYPVSIEYQASADDRPVEKRVASAVRSVLKQERLGDILVFLPGAAEIRACLGSLDSLARAEDIELLPLHGDLSLAEQARAIGHSARRKLILSTNVAETSVTVDGVSTVIDTGTARVLRHSPFSGLPRLMLEKISQASAIQRAGRAGRTRPGRAWRLYSAGDFATRPAQTTPEIQRSDLSELVLLLATLGLNTKESLPWVDEPDTRALNSAVRLLTELGALDEKGSATGLGRQLQRLPLVPRVGRILLAASDLGVSDSGCLVAALLSERDIRRRARAQVGGRTSGPSDVLELVSLYSEAEAMGFRAHALSSLNLDRSAIERVRRSYAKLRRAAPRGQHELEDPEQVDEALMKALLFGFMDRIAKRRRPRSQELVLSNGTQAVLSEHSVVHEGELMLAIEVEQRSDGRAPRKPVVRLCSLLEKDWLLESFEHLLTYDDELVFDDASERVISVSKIAIGSVVLEESRVAAPTSTGASQVLLKAARDRGLFHFDTNAGTDTLLARLELLARNVPELGLAPPKGDRLEELLCLAARTSTSFAELRSVDFAQMLLDSLTPEQQRALQRETPEYVAVGDGFRVKVHYERDKQPYIASRLQNFFSMKEAPSLCKGRVKLTLHLLAPNQRAVQVTQDLSSFWEQHYPALRRQLMRRYPKHAWPEDGKVAKPPARNRNR